MTRPYSRIRSAAIDGRAQNIMFKITQLKNLHQVLVREIDAIEDAIAKDTGYSSVEVKLEYYMAMKSLRGQFVALNKNKALEAEYAIAHKQDTPENREAVGVVIIEPTTHTPFYSIISALSSAIAAGNCVILQLENTMRQTPTLLKRILKETLDGDTFNLATSKVDEKELDHRCAWILQNGSSESLKANQLVSPAQARVVAVVERDADLEEAAKALVTARFSFRGRSPYAPDVVLVNEWVKKEFLTAVVQQSIRYLTEEGGHTNENGYVLEKRSARDKADSVLTMLEQVKKEGGARIVTSGTNGAILDIDRRSSSLLGQKIDSPCLAVHAVSSMDDAIDVSNGSGRLLAAYFFTTPVIAKYLGQFVDADATFVNQVPAQLLLGPAAPLNHRLDPKVRYPVSWLTIPHPEYIRPSAESSTIASLLTTKPKAELIRKLEDEAVAELPTMWRPKKGAAVGFFEQGVIIGGSVILTTIIACASTAGYFGIRFVLQRFRN